MPSSTLVVKSLVVVQPLFLNLVGNPETRVPLSQIPQRTDGFPQI